MAISTATLLFPAGLGTGLVYAGQVLVGGLVFAGVSGVVANALGVMPKKPEMGGGSGLTNRIDPIADFELVYGRTRKGGVKTFVQVTNSTKFLHQIIVLAGHEVNSIGSIFLNDEIVTLDSDGFVTSNDYNSKVFVKKFTGTSTQNIKNTLDNLSIGGQSFSGPTLPSNFKGQGIACLYVRMEYDAEVFANGVPIVTALIDGKKVYDPRKDSTSSAYDASLGVSTHRSNDSTTWQYSDEPALAIRDYLISPFGVGAKHDDIDDVAIATAISKCADVGDVSHEENSLKIGGVLTTGATPLQNLNMLMTTLNGTLFWQQGTWKLIAGAFYAAEASVSGVNAFTVGDIIGPISVATRFSRRDTVNTIKGTFIDSENRYIPTDYPQRQFGLSEDNNEVSTLDFQLPMTTKSAAAQRLAQQVLLVGRLQKTITATFKIQKAFKVQVGDTVEITEARYGFSGASFRVMSWKLDGLDGGVPSVAMTLQETSATAYQWSVSEDEYEQIVSNTTLSGDATSDLGVGTITSSSTGAAGADGIIVALLNLSWTAPSNSLVAYYEVEWRQSGTTFYQASSTKQTSIVIENLKQSTSYEFRVRAVTHRGNVGPDSTGSQTTVGNTTSPPVPTTSQITTTGGFRSITISWQDYMDDSAPSDFDHVEIYGLNVSGFNPSNATRLGRVNGSSFVHSVDPETTFYYRIIVRDFFGNPTTPDLSAYSAQFSGTSLADISGVPSMPVNAFFRGTTDTTPNNNGLLYISADINSDGSPSGTVSDGTWPATIGLSFDEDGFKSETDTTLVRILDEARQATETSLGGGGILVYRNNQNWAWYTPTTLAVNGIFNNQYFVMQGERQTFAGTIINANTSSQFFRLGFGSVGEQGTSGLSLTLNGAEVEARYTDSNGNNVFFNPTTASQDDLDGAFLRVNPLFSSMSELPNNGYGNFGSSTWAVFVSADPEGLTAATAIVSGQTYEIVEVGTTDFKVFDAALKVNQAGASFTASSAGTGSSGTGKVRQISARIWDYSSQDWTAHEANGFTAPQIFSPTVLSFETLSDFISGATVVSENLFVNSQVNMEDGAAWKVNKISYEDENNGMFFGNPTGNLEYAFSTRGVNDGVTHGARFDSVQTRLESPTITKVASGFTSTTRQSSSTTDVLEIPIKNSSNNPNAVSVTINVQGGGGGGAGANSQSTTAGEVPESGLTTTFALTDASGNTLTIGGQSASGSSLGGAAGSGFGADKFRGDAGSASDYAAGGDGGQEGADGTAGTLGSGGGGGGGRAPDWNQSSRKGGAGGGAGEHKTFTFDLTSENNVYLSVTIPTTGGGTGGLPRGGKSSRGDGGDGSKGFVDFRIETSGAETVVLNTQTDFNNMFDNGNGKFNHTSGFQVRFGSWQSTTTGDQTVTFDTAFSNATTAVVTDVSCITKTYSASSFVADRDNDYGNSMNPLTIHYIAIGY